MVFGRIKKVTTKKIGGNQFKECQNYYRTESPNLRLKISKASIGTTQTINWSIKIDVSIIEIGFEKYDWVLSGTRIKQSIAQLKSS